MGIRGTGNGGRGGEAAAGGVWLIFQAVEGFGEGMGIRSLLINYEIIPESGSGTVVGECQWCVCCVP